MQNTRLWVIGGAFAALVVIAVAWFTLIGPELSSARELRTETAATNQQNEVLLAKANTLKAKSAKLSQYTASLKAAQAALPYDSGLPAFTRQVTAQARAHKVSISSLVVGAVTPVVATTVAPTTAGTASGTTSTDPTATGTTAAGGLYSMQVTIQSEGSFNGQLAFLNAVRTTGPRRALLVSTQATPGTGSKARSVERNASVTTQLNIFSAPRSPAQIRQLRKLLSGDLRG